MSAKARLRVTVTTRGDLNTFVFRKGRILPPIVVHERSDGLYDGDTGYARDPQVPKGPYTFVEKHMSEVALRMKEDYQMGRDDPEPAVMDYFDEVIRYLEDLER
jgi:hypothetical protein